MILWALSHPCAEPPAHITNLGPDPCTGLSFWGVVTQPCSPAPCPLSPSHPVRLLLFTASSTLPWLGKLLSMMPLLTSRHSLQGPNITLTCTGCISDRAGWSSQSLTPGTSISPPRTAEPSAERLFLLFSLLPGPMVCRAAKGRGESPEGFDAPSKGETWRQAKRDVLERRGVCKELQIQGAGKVGIS